MRSFFVILCASIQLGNFAYAQNAVTPDAKNYPHWNCFGTDGKFQEKKATDNCTQLTKLNSFIIANSNKNKIAVFDWDGTLYGEKVPTKLYDKNPENSAQSVWHLWAAKKYMNYSKLSLFPAWRTVENGEALTDLIKQDIYLEDKAFGDAYKTVETEKFRQIATMEEGMTIEQMHKGLKYFFADYPTKDYSFYPVLDILQTLINKGFSVWIITGSHPYFIASTLDNIQKTEASSFYNFKTLFEIKKNKIKILKIAGNGSKLLNNSNKFSGAYDDKFVLGCKDENNAETPFPYVVSGYGKNCVLQHIRSQEPGKEICFSASNSDGDYYMAKEVLKKENSFGIFVNPRGKKLIELLANTEATKTVKLDVTSSSGVK